MKKLFLLAIGCIILLSGSYGQSSLLSKKVTLHYTQVNLEVVLKEMGATYQIDFSYSRDMIPMNMKVSIRCNDQPLQEALNTLFTNTNIGFSQIGAQIVLRKNEPLPEKTSNETFLIKGRVTDKITSKPLSFATISLAGKSLGNVTNGEGEFVFKVPTRFMADTLKVSFMGYKPFKISLSLIGNQKAEIALEPDVIELEEVVFEQKTALSILQEALERIPQNYQLGPVKQTLYIRDRTFQDGEPIQATEAVYESYRGRIPDKALQKQMKLIEGRKSKYDQKYADILEAFPALTSFDIGMQPYAVFNADLAEYLQTKNFLGKNGLKFHEYDLETVTHYDGKEVYVIAFDQKEKNKPLYKGKFYIDKQSLAFIHISLSLSPKGIVHATFFGPKVMEKIFGLAENEWISSTDEIHYKQINGKWYIDHISRFSEFNLLKSKRKFNASIFSKCDLVVTEIHTDTIIPFSEQEVASARTISYRQYGEYDETFWNNQNIIKPDKKFEEDFNRINARNPKHGKRLDELISKRLDGKKNRKQKGKTEDLLAEPPTEVEENISNEDNKTARLLDTDLSLTKQTDRFIYLYHPSDTSVIDSIASKLEANYERILSELKVKKLPAIEVRIYPGLEAYHSAINYPNAPAWMVGSAGINKFSIVSPQNAGPEHSYESVMEGVVHEFTHCVHIYLLDNHLGVAKNNDARWLWEGVACYEANQFVSPKILTYLTDGNYPTLEELNHAQDGKVYQMGYLIIDFIKSKYGIKSLLKLITTNGDLAKVLHVSEKEFEQELYLYIRQRYL
ncbi:hypothetical protein GXP67_06020 [Rhodocytophaga rosea]|uniref:Secretin/TonB short N-terminal domain-containing protein n=1 Tax=Rhodocytophaga rosea TaxID=2704465 RepID=A0A6C0GE45_9BACT|nr:carboxypeptidase-like regulatory domain-containing protein [Rhodocytophaga rosea]QHT66245.1 hypothetical protein GXP67_06020 [Rhodocytophaga rosea]